jgi:hypothetical protein
LEEEMVNIGCRVAYVKEDPISPAIGIQFLDLDSENTEKLLAYVCRLGMDVMRR